MYITLKNGKNILLELLMLKNPKYVRWILHFKGIYGHYVDAKEEEIPHLMNLFDSKPILKKCFKKDCNNMPTRFAINEYNGAVCCFCDSCKIDNEGGTYSWSNPIHTYNEALNYARYHGGNTKTSFKYLITKMAEAKGLPKRVGEKEAMRFFHGKY